MKYFNDNMAGVSLQEIVQKLSLALELLKYRRIGENLAENINWYGQSSVPFPQANSHQVRWKSDKIKSTLQSLYARNVLHRLLIVHKFENMPVESTTQCSAELPPPKLSLELSLITVSWQPSLSLPFYSFCAWTSEIWLQICLILCERGVILFQMIQTI